MKTVLIAVLAGAAGLLIGTVWSVAVDAFDPEGEYARLQRLARREKAVGITPDGTVAALLLQGHVGLAPGDFS